MPSIAVFQNISISILLYFLMIGCRIADIIISIYNLTSEYKIYYILSIVSFSLFICIPIIFTISCFYQKMIIVKLLFIEMILCYIVDGVCYFFYVYEVIQNIALLSLMIVSDIFFCPIICFYMEYLVPQ